MAIQKTFSIIRAKHYTKKLKNVQSKQEDMTCSPMRNSLGELLHNRAVMITICIAPVQEKVRCAHDLMTIQYHSRVKQFSTICKTEAQKKVAR